METQRRIRGDTMRHIRELKGLSMQAVNDRGGPTPTTISYVENGKHAAQPGTLQKLAHALEVPVEVFYLDPGAAEEAVLDNPLGFGKQADPNDELLGFLRDAASAYDPQSGLKLEWSAEDYDRVMNQLVPAAQRAAQEDFKVGKDGRALAILKAAITAVVNLDHRHRQLVADERPAPAPPEPIRPELVAVAAVEDQLEKLAATA